MSKTMTVGEIKEKLQKYPDDMKVLVYCDGKSWDYPVLEEDWVIRNFSYFGGSDIENEPEEDEDVLVIASI